MEIHPTEAPVVKRKSTVLSNLTRNLGETYTSIISDLTESDRTETFKEELARYFSTHINYKNESFRTKSSYNVRALIVLSNDDFIIIGYKSESLLIPPKILMVTEEGITKLSEELVGKSTTEIFFDWDDFWWGVWLGFD